MAFQGIKRRRVDFKAGGGRQRGGTCPSSPDERPLYRGLCGLFCWNSQAYFATRADTQEAKQSYFWRLMDKRDFGGITETHRTTGKILTARAHTGYRSFWSHGSNAQAGVALVVKDEFLKRFNPVRETD